MANKKPVAAKKKTSVVSRKQPPRLKAAKKPATKKPLPQPRVNILPESTLLTKLEALTRLIGTSKYIFVVYTEKTRPSGKALTEALRKALPTTVIGSGTVDLLKGLIRSVENHPSTIINVGVANHIDSSAPVINKSAAVLHSSNKRLARITFQDAGVCAPDLWLSAVAIPASGFPVVGRTTNHTKASGFWFCKNAQEAKQAEAAGATHFMRFIQNTREFRIHLMATHLNSQHRPEDYVSIKLSEKVRDPGVAKNSDIIKNHDNGWVFKFPEDPTGPVFNKVREIAKEAIAALKLDWGAVDVIYGLADKKAYVLEINTSPCLTDDTANTVDKYAAGLSRLISGETRTPRQKTATPAVKAKTKSTTDRDIVRNLIKRVGL